MLLKEFLILKGGPGSGNYGHAGGTGGKGQRGGSRPTKDSSMGAVMSMGEKGRTAEKRQIKARFGAKVKKMEAFLSRQKEAGENRRNANMALNRIGLLNQDPITLAKGLKLVNPDNLAQTGNRRVIGEFTDAAGMKKGYVKLNTEEKKAYRNFANATKKYMAISEKAVEIRRLLDIPSLYRKIDSKYPGNSSWSGNSFNIGEPIYYSASRGVVPVFEYEKVISEFDI